MRRKREIVVDSFAGGGGASLGIAWATGRAPDIAINHDRSAIEMHKANHPSTRHYVEDVFSVDIRKICKGRKIGLLWASPDCRDFSNAKGDRPVSRHVRGLAWTVVKWATQYKPRVIILENVREFEQWAPLVPRWVCQECKWKGSEGQATLVRTRRRCPRCESLKLKETDDKIRDPARLGLSFKIWVGRLRGLGYRVEWRTRNAANAGAPTHRRRLFLVARCDGQPIVWPEPTHTSPTKVGDMPLFAPLKPWRTAAECIDWDLPCPSIFDRKRPLKDRTMERIARGVKRYVLEAEQPFIVRANHGGDHFRGQAVDQPFCTVTSARDAHGLVTPFVVPVTRSGGSRAQSAGVPLHTITTAKGGEFAIVAPTLIQTGYGERPGQAPRTLDLHKPLGTVVAGGQKHALVAAFLAKHFGGVVGVPVNTPTPTTTTRGTQNQLVTAMIAKYHGQKGAESHCTSMDEPLRVVDTENRHSVVAANLVHMNHGEKQWSSVEEPLRTVTQNNHAALVYSFLIRYFGTAIGQHVTEPLFTITGKDRFGLVTVAINGEPYVIVDIGMRMLTPRELARAQGFPDTYILTGNRSNQVKKIGNSVSPYEAKAMVEANYCGVLV